MLNSSLLCRATATGAAQPALLGNTLFSTLSAYAGDPILSLQLAYRDDVRPDKVNLSIGLYYDEEGRIPRLESVQRAQRIVNESVAASTYLPMSGSPAYCQASQELVFGADSLGVQEGRIATIQTVGGSG